MNETRNHADDLDWDDAQWCQLYLLGELSPEQSERFERRIGESPEIAEQLLSHSDLLLAIAPEIAGVSHRPIAARNRTQTFAMVAIAASLMAVVTAGWYQRQRRSEELLIARAWVETFSDDPVDSRDVVVTLDESLVDTDGEHFDWMFVAVSIGDSLVQPTTDQRERESFNEG